MIRRILVAAAVAAFTLPQPAPGQFTRPWLEWRTLRTDHFDVHYPAELEAWTRDAVSRLEGARAAVALTVGSAPAQRVTVVVDNPAGEANGVAFSFLRTPYILLYPTPPDPRSQLGHTRSSVEQLVVHEYAHVAHLTRPSRNPFTRWVDAVDPRGTGPLAAAPRWLKEGYATYLEGRLTGSGRPHGVARAAVLRQWALQGRLPAYEQLDAQTGPYQAGGMAYLAGSAFLEWLAQRAGDESLVHLWRRMSARRERSFDQAFTGVFGGSPREMYGFFTVDLTANALEARRRLQAAGLVAGDTVQRLTWGTGDPAVSPDGQHLAITLRGPSASATRIVVWPTAEPAPDTAAEAQRRRLLDEDPEDVANVDEMPRPRRPVAQLRPLDGLPYTSPRFLPGGEELLVVRAAPIGGGATRTDLFVWNWRRHTLRRLTHGASIRGADPVPDGRRAAAVQCANGFCGLVMVDLANGRITPLAPGTPGRVFDRPRVSPDGRTVAAAMQEGGRWKIVAVDADGGPVRVVHGDAGASAYDPVWSPDGSRLVAVSEAGGIANLAVVELETGAARPLTRVTGAAVAPEVDRRTGGIYFLSLHAGGLSLHRIHPDSAAPGPAPELPSTLAPAVPPAAATVPDTLPRGPVPPARAYGLGPRWIRILPMGFQNADGGIDGLTVYSADPVGRLGVAAQAAWGRRPGLERGASLTAVWRGMRPAVTGEVFYLDHHPSRLPAYDRAGRDGRYAGAALAAGNGWSVGRRVREWHAGVSAGQLDLDGGGGGTRVLAFGEWRASSNQRSGATHSLTEVAVAGQAGRTAGTGWGRGVLSGAFGVGYGMLGMRAEGTIGRVSAGAPVWERFTVGGGAPLLADDAVLGQRVPMPALRWGALEGRHLLTWRLSTTLGLLTPYFWGGTTDPSADGWLRVTGVEISAAIPHLRAAGSPGLRMLAGVAYGLDGGYEHDLTAYVGVRYVP